MSGQRPAAGAGYPKMTLSRVRNPDHELLLELQEYDFEAFGATGLRIIDLAVMAQDGAIFVAHVGSEMVGSCQLMRVLDEPDFFYVVGLYIRPRWRGLHLGRELLRLIAEESRRLGAHGLVLSAAPGNVAGLALYRSAGFVEDRFVPNLYGDKEDRYILRWRFPEGAPEWAEGEGLLGSV
jgi:ribosomal-protein-alanine N-acetyltransferase